MKIKIIYFTLGVFSCFLVNWIFSEKYTRSLNYPDKENAYALMSYLHENKIRYFCETDHLNRLWITPHIKKAEEFSYHESMFEESYGLN